MKRIAVAAAIILMPSAAQSMEEKMPSTQSWVLSANSPKEKDIQQKKGKKEKKLNREHLCRK